MKPVFYPYKMHSSSAKTLAKEFGVERVRDYGHFRNNFKRPIINWGNSQRPEWMNRWPDQVILNEPHHVANAANKLASFMLFKQCGVRHPEWTTDTLEASRWRNEGIIVLLRKTLTGKGGEGIEIYEHEEGIQELNLPNAPLYTQYFKKKKEYRVHVMQDKVISFAEKKISKTATVEEVNFQIRNADNGWVFCHDGIVLPECVKIEAIKAVKALGLDFGAVDIGYNVAKKEPCVFEVNTAPGIEGSTVEHYKKAFEEVLK